MTDYFNPVQNSKIKDLLTVREEQVLTALEEGLSNKVIAVRLYIFIVSVLLADGNGGYTETFYGGNETISATIADMNVDSEPDIVTANYDGGGMTVLLADGNGGYVAPSFYYTGISAELGLNISLFVADMNGDGLPDVVVADGDITNLLRCFYYYLDDGRS